MSSDETWTQYIGTNVKIEGMEEDKPQENIYTNRRQIRQSKQARSLLFACTIVVVNAKCRNEVRCIRVVLLGFLLALW